MGKQELNLNWYEVQQAKDTARASIPAHLDADEIIDFSWENTADITDKGIYDSVEENVIQCFISTVEMYIDQNGTTS